jgi:hypothetical protein
VAPKRKPCPKIEGAFMPVQNLLRVDFRASAEAERHRRVRAVIRKIKRDVLTKAERDVLMAVVNLWFYHGKSGAKMIYPGRKKLALKADVSIPTVARALDHFRKLGILEAQQYAQGGRNSTRYKVCIHTLMETFDPSDVEYVSGTLVPFMPQNSVSNDTVSEAQNDTV